MFRRAIVAVATMVITVAILSAAPSARAWDAAGHEQIADIAWLQLNARARARIGLILMAGDPEFRPASTADADVRKAFRLASTFADVIKRNHDTAYESIIDPMNLLFQKSVERGDREGDRCKTWHYYDTPLHYTGARPTVKSSNALVALNYAISHVAVGSDRKTQCWWLYWIEHITGDLHQPLHCADNYEHNPVKGDAGGNSVRLAGGEAASRGTNLHAYWDAGIDHAKADERADQKLDRKSENVEAVSARWSAEPSLKPAAHDADDLKAADWIAAGAKLAETVVYPGVEPGTEPSDAYRTVQDELCRKQAVLAGTRLARILNKALGS